MLNQFTLFKRGERSRDLCGFGDKNVRHFSDVAITEGGVLGTRGEREYKI